MNSPSHKLLFSTFAAAWAFYLVAETARMAADAAPECDHFDDLEDDAMEYRCEGRTAGAVFMMLGAAASAVSIIFSSNNKMRLTIFLLSVMSLCLSYGSYYAGDAQSACDNDDDSNGCDGNRATTVFYMFAAVAAILAAAVHFRLSETQHYFVILAFGVLAFVALGETAWYARQAEEYCDDLDVDDDDVAEVNAALCTGNGFAAFFMVMGVLTALSYAAFVFLKKSVEKATMVWFVWAAMYLLARAASSGALAQVNCDIVEETDISEKYCQGYGAGTFFLLVATLVAALGIALDLMGTMEKFHTLSFYLSFAIFYLGYGAVMGGLSAGGCEFEKELPKEAPDYVKDLFNARCNGYAASTFFGILSFVVLLVAAVLSQTSYVASAEADKTPAEVVTAEAIPKADADEAQKLPAGTDV